FRHIPIQHHFHRVITSHSLGIAKENPSFWSSLQQIEPFESEHTLFIDDNLQVLCNAKRQGVRYLLTIAQPDSNLPPRKSDDFPALDCFKQLMNGSAPAQLA
ncbi:MAG: haloacid dehalogenase, partial [Thiothrix sp.]|nr:haloacid dehalogenase [Thiothrix sp.]